MNIQRNKQQTSSGQARLRTDNKLHKHPRSIIFYILLITILIGLVWSFNGLRGLLSNSGSAQAASDPVIAAAGDIACDPTNSNFNLGKGTTANCREKATSDLLINGGFAAVLPLGDNQYYCGGYQAFLQSYDPTWGRVLSITHPVVGNHEYLTSGGTGCNTTNKNAAGYFKYYGAAAGTPGAGYYSYDIGTWHLTRTFARWLTGIFRSLVPAVVPITIPCHFGIHSITIMPT